MNERATPGEECDCGPWVMPYGFRVHQPHQFAQTFIAGTTTDWRCVYCLRFAGQRREGQI